MDSDGRSDRQTDSYHLAITANSDHCGRAVTKLISLNVNDRHMFNLSFCYHRNMTHNEPRRQRSIIRTE